MSAEQFNHEWIPSVNTTTNNAMHEFKFLMKELTVYIT